jgi:hypothetical protein
MAAAFCLGEVPGRGRALRAARDIAAGEVVLTDWPVLLTCSQDAVDSVCSCCLRLLQGPGERAASSALAQPMLPHLPRGCAGHQGPARARSVGTHASALKRVRGPRWATPRATRLPPAGKPSRAAAQAVHLQVSLCCFAPTHRSSQRDALRRSALARLDFAGLGGDERNALRYLAQANALRVGAAAGDAEAAARWRALMGLAGGLPAAADASDLYGRLARALAPLGGPSAGPRAQRAAGSGAD